MSSMTKKQMDDAARVLVTEYLADGPEDITVAEYLWDEYGSEDDAHVHVAKRVRQILNEVYNAYVAGAIV